MKGSAGPIDRYLGKRIRARRNALHLSLAALAERLGLSGEQIRQYELGHDRLSAARPYEISVCLNVNVAFLYDGFARQTAVMPGFADAGQENYSTSAIDAGTRDRLNEAAARLADPQMRASFAYIMKHLPAAEPSLDPENRPVVDAPLP